MQVNAKVDYALRALAELSTAGAGPVKPALIDQPHVILHNYLDDIMLELGHAGIVKTHGGAVRGG